MQSGLTAWPVLTRLPPCLAASSHGRPLKGSTVPFWETDPSPARPRHTGKGGDPLPPSAVPALDLTERTRTTHRCDPVPVMRRQSPAAVPRCIRLFTSGPGHRWAPVHYPLGLLVWWVGPRWGSFCCCIPRIRSSPSLRVASSGWTGLNMAPCLDSGCSARPDQGFGVSVIVRSPQR